MSEIGLCRGCKKPRAMLVFRCKYCGDKFCITCVNTNNKCPTCGKVAYARPAT